MDAGNDETRPFSTEEKTVAEGILVPGTLVGAYRIERFIDRGGGGAVYEARHLTEPGRAAIKILHAKLAAIPKMVERFARESQVLTLLRHPNIVEVHAIGVLPDRRPFYVMEHVEGTSLHRLFDERGRFSPEEALAILEPVCAALASAHAAGVVHRDIKASNISISRGEPPTIKLLDFGIAKLIGPTPAGSGITSAGRQIGTFTVMAPEQLLAGLVDARTDIYALGALLYRMLTGQLPFLGRTRGALIRQHLEEPPPRPSQHAPVVAALDAVVLRCLEKRPEQRFQSVTGFLAALRAAVGKHGEAPEEEREIAAPAVGICLEIRMAGDDEDFDDALGDDVGSILDLVGDSLVARGFTLALATGSGVLGVRQLVGEPAKRRREREEALELALALHAALGRRATADARVHPNLCVHAADVLVRPGSRPEIRGGALIRTDQWAPQGVVASLCATREALHDLTGFDVSPGSASWVTVTPRSR
jgi:serine/threonine-protein kinase